MSDASNAQVTFQPMGETVSAEIGETLLDVALENKIPIENACGGAGACATCHVIVHEGAALLSETTEEEEDTLDTAASVTPNSRLACQAQIIGAGPIVVEIPDWNRNLVSEHE